MEKPARVCATQLFSSTRASAVLPPRAGARSPAARCAPHLARPAMRRVYFARGMASALPAALLSLTMVGHGPAAMVGHGPAAPYCVAVEMLALRNASLTWPGTRYANWPQSNVERTAMWSRPAMWSAQPAWRRRNTGAASRRQRRRIHRRRAEQQTLEPSPRPTMWSRAATWSQRTAMWSRHGTPHHLQHIDWRLGLNDARKRRAPILHPRRI